MAHFHRVVYYNRRRPCRWCKDPMALSVTCSACAERTCVKCSGEPDEFHAMKAKRVVCKDCVYFMKRLEPMKEQLASFDKKSHEKKMVTKVLETNPLETAEPAEPAAECPPSPSQMLFQTALFSMMEQVTSSPFSLDMEEKVVSTPPPTVRHTPKAPHKRTKAKYRDPAIVLLDTRLRSPNK
jgi:hypothetical protein